MAFPQDVLSTKVEIWYDQQWNEITSDVRGTGTEDGEIEIDPRGQPDESSGLSVAQASLSVNNRDGKYSPRNFVSPLYGKIGMNTPLRIITDVGDTANVEDDFSTDGTNGWPTADSGHEYTESGGAAADYFTSGGLAYHRHTAVSTGHECYLSSLEVTDFDCLVEGISLEALPTGDSVHVFLRARISNGGMDFVQVDMEFFPSDSVQLHLSYSLDGVGETVIGPLLQPDGNDTISIRFRGVGRKIYTRGWETGTTEPDTWDNTLETPVITPGQIMLGSDLRSGVTNVLPFDITFQELSFNLGIILFTGEVAEWPKRWDKTGNDVWTSITASGLTRRLSQGNKPIGSPLYRHYKRMDLLAYTSFENMTGTSTAYPTIPSDLDGGAAMVSQNPNPAQDAEIKWSDESTLLGSDPLPSVLVGASTFGYMEYGGSNMLPSSITDDTFTIGFWYNVQLREDVADSVQNVNVVLEVQNGDPAAVYQFLVQHKTVAGVHSTDVSAYALSADLSTVVSSIVEFTITYEPGWHYFVLDVGKSGSNLLMLIYKDGELVTSVSSAPITTVGQPSRLRWINVGAYTSTISSSIGHFAIASGVFASDLWNNLDETTAIGLEAYSGELAATRLTRLFAEEGITFELDEGGSLADPDPGTELGPQRSDTFLNLIQAAAQADDGVLYEMREDFGYRYRTRWALYGREIALELDYSNGDLSEVPETTDDDQRLRNKIIVKRDGGSGEVIAEQTTGPLSTNDPRAVIPGAGVYDDSATVSLHSDDQRVDYAHWRKYLGTWDESRFPGVSVALHRTQFTGNKTKMASAALLDVAEILTIINPPVWLPPDSVVLQMRSVKIFLSNFNWGIEWNCLPGRPWQEVATATAEYGRADTASSSLESTIDDNDTVLVVTTAETDLPRTDPLWTEDISELNILGSGGFDLRLNPATIAGGLGGERVRVAKNEIIVDNFTRSGQLSGSNADTGQTWVSSFGTAANATTDGTKAVLAHPSANTALVQTLPGTNPDMCLEVDVSFNFVTATGASIFTSIVMRQTDLSNYYSIILEKQNGDANPVLYVQKVVAGVATNLFSRRITDQSVFRFKIEFRNRDILLKQWDPSTSVEGDWSYTLRGAAGDNLTGTDIAFRTSRSTGNTNTNPAINFDNLKVTTGKIRPYIYDRFARTVSNGLGSATTGEAWTLWGSGGGDPNDYDVAPNRASITVPDVNNAFRGAYLASVDLQDVCVSYTWESPIHASAQAYRPGLVALRMQGTATFILFTMTQTSAEVLTGHLINASGATLAGPTTLWANLPNSTVRMRTKVAAIGNKVMAKVWPPESPEPDYWQMTATDTDPVVSGHVGWLHSRDLASGVVPTMTVEDFRIDNPQKITVQRGMDGVSRAWDAGTDVRLWTPARVGR